MFITSVVTQFTVNTSLSNEAYLAFYSICAEESFAVSKAAWELTTHLYPVLRLRTRGATLPPLPPYMPYCRKRGQRYTLMSSRGRTYVSRKLCKANQVYEWLDI